MSVCISQYYCNIYTSCLESIYCKKNITYKSNIYITHDMLNAVRQNFVLIYTICILCTTFKATLKVFICSLPLVFVSFVP